METKTVRISNVALKATQQDLLEFFSFSGQIEYIEMQSAELSQVAYITFREAQGAETALLLTGATIVESPVTIVPAPDYQLPLSASSRFQASDTHPPRGVETALQKAEDVVVDMLAKGFILGRDAIDKAKAFDEKHQLTSTATARVSSFDKKIGLSEKISQGTTVVNEKVKDLDQKYQVTEKTKSALTAAEQTVTTAGSAIMKNRYVLTGTAWVAGAFSRVTAAASDAASKVKENLAPETPEHKTTERDLHEIHISSNLESPHHHSPAPVSPSSAHSSSPAAVEIAVEVPPKSPTMVANEDAPAVVHVDDAHHKINSDAPAVTPADDSSNAAGNDKKKDEPAEGLIL